MKGGFAAAAVAALAGSAHAISHHRHAHELFKKGANLAETFLPECTTIWTTITGEPTLVPGKPTSTSSSTPIIPTSSSLLVSSVITPVTTLTPTPTPAPAPTTSVVVPVPTPEVHTCPTPGTYTFPATTITVTQSTTVCGASSTQVPPGTHTVGGVTTVVETATTVTCPYATVITSGTVTTSTIVQTKYVCPSAGTYTIAPITTTVTDSTVIVFPVPTSFAPGTYTAPQQVVTVTETGYVYVCPLSSAGLPTTSVPAPAPVSSEAPVSKAPVSSQAPVSKAPVTSEAPVSKAPVTSKAPAVSTTTSKAAAQTSSVPSTGSGGLTSDNDHYGITYTPYVSTTGNCKTAEEVDADLKEIKDSGFTTIRVYSTDCDMIENVIPACQKYKLQIILGVFVKDTGCTYEVEEIKEQVDALAAMPKSNWDLVPLLVVGNEAIMNQYCTATELATLITTVKSKCSSFSGLVTISETINIWQQTEVQAAILPVTDICAANAHAFFDPNTTPKMAGDFIAGQLDILAEICEGKEVINLECGWPTAGICNGLACPGVSEQLEAITEIRAKAGHKTVFFSYENDLWKDKGPYGCEQSFGSKDVFRS